MSHSASLEERVATLERSLQEVRDQIAQPDKGSSMSSGHPLAEFAGIWKDHPEREEFRQAMIAYRQQVNSDTD